MTLELVNFSLSSNFFSKFKNQNDFTESLKQFDDVAIGGHIRFGKIGFNLNWAQTSLKNNSVNGVTSIENQAKYKSDQINATALVFLPIIPKRAELFIEGGMVDIGSKLNYTPNGGVKIEKKSHQHTTGNKLSMEWIDKIHSTYS